MSLVMVVVVVLMMMMMINLFIKFQNDGHTMAKLA